MTKAHPQPPAAQLNTPPAVIERDAVYTLDELARRLRWRKHSRSQALRNGLRTSKFGSRRYVLGADALRFFEDLASQQNQDPSVDEP